MTIPLQCASLRDRQEVPVWSNCLLDLGTDFLVADMVFCMRCVVSRGSTPPPRPAFLRGAPLPGPTIHKHTGRRMRQGSALVVPRSREKHSCQSKLVSALSVLLPVCVIPESIPGPEPSSATAISWLMGSLYYRLIGHTCQGLIRYPEVVFD